MVSLSVQQVQTDRGEVAAPRTGVSVTTVGTFQRQPGTTYRTRRDPRVLRDNQFLWIMEGAVTWTSGGETYDVGPDTVLLACAGEPDYFRWNGPGETSMGFFHFNVDRAPRVGRWPKVRHLPPDDLIRPLFRHIAWLTETRPAQWRRQRAAAAALLLEAFVSGACDTKPRTHADLPPAVVRAMEYVEKSWADGPMYPITLAELAAASSVSVRHLCRSFSEAVGCGPTEALRLVRLHQAANLLTHTNHSVAQIAEFTGFTNPFHFSHRFAEVYGRPPRAYRRHTVDFSDAAAPPPHVHRLLGRLWERS
jgi:AraC family transcriptional regulator